MTSTGRDVFNVKICRRNLFLIPGQLLNLSFCYTPHISGNPQSIDSSNSNGSAGATINNMTDDNSKSLRGDAPDPVQENFLPPMAGEGIHAGFPSPAQDYMSPCIDLNKELVRHPAATFYGRVVGDSMVDAGVDEGDILVIDKSIEATEGDMCVCFVDGEFTLKYLSFRDPSSGEKCKGGNAIWLVPANPAYPPIKVSDPSFSVWGVVTYVIKKTYRKSGVSDR